MIFRDAFMILNASQFSIGSEKFNGVVLKLEWFDIHAFPFLSDYSASISPITGFKSFNTDQICFLEFGVWSFSLITSSGFRPILLSNNVSRRTLEEIIYRISFKAVECVVLQVCTLKRHCFARGLRGLWLVHRHLKDSDVYEQVEALRLGTEQCCGRGPIRQQIITKKMYKKIQTDTIQSFPHCSFKSKNNGSHKVSKTSGGSHSW